MAKQNTNDVVVTISSVDYSSQVTSVSVPTSSEELDVTSFGDAARRKQGGLFDGSVSISLLPTADLTNLATITALLGTVTAFTIKMDSAGKDATNPELQANALWTGIEWGGEVGGLMQPTLSGSLDTVVTYATS